jgi:hypothetical protein
MTGEGFGVSRSALSGSSLLETLSPSAVSSEPNDSSTLSYVEGLGWG